MGAIFRKSKKKPIPSSKTSNPKEATPHSPEKDSSFSKKPQDKKYKTIKIIPIQESLNEALNTNENKEKEPVNMKNIDEKFSNISSIRDIKEINPPSNNDNENDSQIQLQKSSPKKPKKQEKEDPMIEKIDNDFVDENNEQMINNPHFAQVFMKDPAWANQNIAKKLNEFNWPAKGFVEIKALCFEIKYDYKLKGFRVLRNSENMNSSILSWNRVEEEKYYSFDLKDINTFNLKTGQVQQNKKMNQGLKFGVDFNGNYVTF